MTKKYNIAVLGATGNVGGQILACLKERNFPVGNIYALASQQSIGKQVSFGDSEILDIEDIASFNFNKVDIAFSALDNESSKKFVPKATKCGVIVIDNSSHWRQHESVPLVIPEINGEAISGYSNLNIIANPNCSTIQLLMALKPLHDEVPIKRVVVATYQSTAGAGKAAMDELYNQTKARYVFKETDPQHFPKTIAFNVIPQIGDFDDEGNSSEELKMQTETNKILDNDLPLSVTCVRVPTFVGHAEAVNIVFDGEMTTSDVYEILQDAPGIALTNNILDHQYHTPIDVGGSDDIFVSRIRADKSIQNGINMWLVADPLRKGAATNAVQIAEELIKIV